MGYGVSEDDLLVFGSMVLPTVEGDIRAPWHLYPEIKKVFVIIEVGGPEARKAGQEEEHKNGAYQLKDGNIFVNIDWLIDKDFSDGFSARFLKHMKKKIITNYKRG